MNTMAYKGYQAIIEFDDEAELFHGEIAGLRDVVTFQGRSVAELKKAFKESIEDYLNFCAERGEQPEKPFSGQFIVRTGPQTHRLAMLAANSKGMSLNAWVTSVIENAGHATRISLTPEPRRVSAAKVARKKVGGPSSRHRRSHGKPVAKRA